MKSPTRQLIFEQFRKVNRGLHKLKPFQFPKYNCITLLRIRISICHRLLRSVYLCMFKCVLNLKLLITTIPFQGYILCCIPLCHAQSARIHLILSLHRIRQQDFIISIKSYPHKNLISGFLPGLRPRVSVEWFQSIPPACVSSPAGRGTCPSTRSPN